jgi:glycyl-tRNA synthetase beta chain
MDREVLLEIGCEEIPASWLPGLTRQLGDRLAARLADARLAISAPVETYSTPRRLTARVDRVGERQSDFEETITGPPVAAAFTPSGEPTPAAAGFARKHGVEVSELATIETPRGPYLAFQKRLRSKAAVDVLPDVLGATLRDLTFPRQMRWDALLEDGKGDFLFGRPIRWLLFLYGGRVVPFTIARAGVAQAPQVQEVRSGALTYGHRFLATSGRAGRAIKVRSFDDYRARLAEHFVVLDRGERHDRIARELDVHARRLGGRVMPAARQSALLQEVPDLVEYPTVVAGTFAVEFLDLPEEVLTVTMIHHQHFFPVVGDHGRLLPAFLSVTNTQQDNARTIARNEERVLTARLRDARFFWHADRQSPLDSRLERLETVLFHKKLGNYRVKAQRIEALARWIAAEALQSPGHAATAARAARLAKADLVTDMVREFTELQGIMGGIYAREDGEPDEVWKAIYHHYLPAAVEADAPPTRDQLGGAATSWAAVSLADKADTIVGLFAAGERPTGTRDPFALRRLAHGFVKTLVDLGELGGPTVAAPIQPLLRKAAEGYGGASEDYDEAVVMGFLVERLRYLFERRGFAYDEINAVLAARLDDRLAPLDVRRRLDALRGVRQSEDFGALAALFKRVKNIAREAGAEPQPIDRQALREPAERALLDEIDRRAPAIVAAAAAGDYARAFQSVAAFAPLVDRFFTDVFVMVEELRLRSARLALMGSLRDLILGLADISEIAAPAGGGAAS